MLTWLVVVSATALTTTRARREGLRAERGPVRWSSRGRAALRAPGAPIGKAASQPSPLSPLLRAAGREGAAAGLCELHG